MRKLNAVLCGLFLSILVETAHALDVARAEARVDAAVAQFGLTGKGVIVAVLDRGIDWKNSDFRKEDGTTRIKWIFDLTNDAGATAPGNKYGKGTLYTEAQINEALANGTDLPTRDAVGHGTTTAGIAAGNGLGLANRKYRGVAPEASLIIVKIIGGAPAHGNQPAEPSFYDPSRVLLGIDFVRDKAKELGLPCVMLPNYGSIEGPTDGTSPLARKIDSVVGPGLLFVNGPGDEGGMPNRATGTVTQGGTASIDIKKGQAGPLRFHLWYRGEDRFNVSIVTPTATFGPYTAPANDRSLSVTEAGAFLYLHNGAERTTALNGKREIIVNLNGPAGTYKVQLQGTAVVADGSFNAGLNPSFITQPPATANGFLTFVYPGNLGNIWDGATAALNICPGDYVIRTQWTDIDGISRSNLNQGSVGQIWTGSSAGPTYDGRLGVDFCAPGDSLFTTYAPNSFWATARHAFIQDGAGKYGRANAVSAAAPFATGVIALMLQMNPKLDPTTAKRILQETARADVHTGTVPNPQWGHGKIDALAALARTADTIPPDVSISRVGAAIRLSFSSILGKNYKVEYRESLTSGPEWSTLPGAASVAGTGAVVNVTDPNATTRLQRFYRVVGLPAALALPFEQL